MNKLEMIDTIIFDYDGTLHESSEIYIPAFKKAYEILVRKGLVEPRKFRDKEITKWLGYDKVQMWETFQPQLESNYRNEASECIGSEMLRSMLNGEAKLYDHAIEVLEYLKNKGYRLVFLSNCSIDYMDLHTKIFGLKNYFDEMICSEQYNFEKSKKEIVEERFPEMISKCMMIGDRKQDIEVGLLNHVLSVGCTYGYGLYEEIETSDIKIDQLKELLIYL